jgi:glycosyltransferase involved in cell wall biosynthesis
LQGVDSCDEIIGFAGRLVPLKGVEYLLQAIAILKKEYPSIQLRLAGSGPERDRLEQLTTALSLKENVLFLDWVEDVNAERSRWSVTVQPSLQEGLPMNVLESMAAGVPVIASRVGGIPEVIRDGINGLLVGPRNSSQLAEAIGRLLTDASLRNRLGLAAVQTIMKGFSAEKMSAEVSALYDELLA